MTSEFWQLLATMSATMVGLVFVGTYYYLQSGWKTFTFFQTELEEITLGYAKLIISYFSTVLGISLLQQSFLTPFLTTVFYVVAALVVIWCTRQLNKTLRRQEQLFKGEAFRIAVWATRIWFLFVFVVPHLFRFSSTVKFLLREQSIPEETLIWTSLAALTVAYINLVQFLLLPHDFHKRERDETARLNKEALLQGKPPPKPVWDELRVRNATERIEKALDNLGLLPLSNVDTSSTYLTGQVLSGELTRPILRYPPRVSEYGEAMVHLLIPDDWNSDKQLLEQSVLLAKLVGVAVFEACRDLTGLDVRIWRTYVKPWSKEVEPILILRLRWGGEALQKLGKMTKAEDILKSVSEMLLHPSLFPLGFIEDDFDPAGREPEEGEAFRIYDVKDLSHAMAKRYSAKVVVHKGTSREELRHIIPQVVKEVRMVNVYRNQESRERWGGKPAQVVWVDIFDEARHPPEMVAIEGVPYFVGSVEWIDPNLDPNYAPMSMIYADEQIGNIRVKWARQCQTKWIP